MLIKRLIILLILPSCLAVQAQDSLLLRDYQFVKRSDPWLTCHNAAALTRYSTGSIAEAELSYTKQRGGFVNYYQSSDLQQIDASIESFVRLNNRTVVFGGMVYDSFDGKDMAGSVFVNPDRLPFDIVEDSVMNAGGKHRDTYWLSGGFGSSLFSWLSLGARLDYTSANYAKYKDLRHQNKLMDLRFSASAYIPFASWGALGMGYLYGRNTESLQMGTYGKTDKTYMSLVSYAAFMGHLEQFGAAGYTDKNREMPLVTDENGLSVQFSLASSRLSFYHSFAYSHGKGYYGRKSPFTITYTDHLSDSYDYAARVMYHTAVVRHSVDFSFSIETLQNKANTYREMKNESNATYYDYYTPVKTANKLWKDVGITYTLDWDIRGELPSWTVIAGASWSKRRQTGYAYPYYRCQELHHRRFFVSVDRNLVTTRGVWSLALEGAFQNGEGEPYEDLYFQKPSDKQGELPSMDTWLYQEYRYLTAPQYRVGGSVKYAFLFPGTRLKTHASLRLAHHKANETNDYSAGRDNTSCRLAIGCTF